MSTSTRELGGVVGYGKRDNAVRRVITAQDALWVARSLMGEVGSAGRPERLAVASTMVRGWLLSGQSSLGTWVQGFSQPVNPRWLPCAELWNAHVAALARGEREGQESATSVAAGERRRRFRTLPWMSIPADVRADVVALLSGRLELTAGKASNFAGPNLYRRHGLVTTTLAERKATAPGAVRARETARRVVGPEYEHVNGSGARGNVFHSTAAGRVATFRVEPGEDVSDVLPAPPAPPYGEGGGVKPAVALGALGAVVVAVAVGVA